MIHKLYLILTALVAFAITASAQQKTGRWTIYATATDTWTNVVEAGDKTYMHNGPSLFSISDADNEIYAYNAYNKLSDRAAISMIRYNKAGGYLFTAYENGNIDLVYDDGHVENLPEIKDAVLSSGRTINDVAFADGKIYVAAEFGIAVYDDKTCRVSESGIYNRSVRRVFVMGDHLVLAVAGASDIQNEIFASPLSERHNQLERFANMGFLYFRVCARITDSSIADIHPSSRIIYSHTFDFENNKITGRSLNVTLGDRKSVV